MTKAIQKYTTSGKKVNIVTKLNDDEYIVQEVYVDDNGIEHNAGQNFVERSICLLDVPVKTWAQKQYDELADQHRILKTKVGQIEYQHDLKKEELKAISELAKQSNCILKSLTNFDFNHFCDIFTGQAKYAVDEYGIISHFMDAITSYENKYYFKQFESIKLISLIGRSDGNLAYNISYYSDGSGGVTRYRFTADLNQAAEWAMEHARHTMDQSYNVESIIKNFKTFNIDVPAELADYHIAYNQKRIDQRRDEALKRYNDELERIAQDELKNAKL